eukprot:1730052-Prymnesium_polylepis.1
MDPSAKGPRPAHFADAVACEANQERSTLRRNDTLFIFTNQVGSKSLAPLTSVAVALSLNIRWAKDVHAAASKAHSCRSLHLQDPHVASLLEQFISAHATGVYFATLASSWDELVLYLRSRRLTRSSGNTNALIAAGQLEAFIAHIRSMQSHQGELLKKRSAERKFNANSLAALVESAEACDENNDKGATLEGSCYPCRCKLLRPRLGAGAKSPFAGPAWVRQ